MSNASLKLDYAAPRGVGKSALTIVRLAIALFGIALPYLARIPGMVRGRPDWLQSYFEGGLGAFIFFGAFNAINWGAILVGTFAYRSVPAALVAAAIGFAWPAYAHATLDLWSDPQAAISLIFIPIYSLPLVAVGWLAGFALDRAWRRRGTRTV